MGWVGRSIHIFISVSSHHHSIHLIGFPPFEKWGNGCSERLRGWTKSYTANKLAELILLWSLWLMSKCINTWTLRAKVSSKFMNWKDYQISLWKGPKKLLSEWKTLFVFSIFKSQFFKEFLSLFFPKQPEKVIANVSTVNKRHFPLH